MEMKIDINKKKNIPETYFMFYPITGYKLH